MSSRSKHVGASNWRTAVLSLSGIQQVSAEKGLSERVTDKQRSTKPQYRPEGGSESPLRAEFTGDKVAPEGAPEKKELSAWRAQAELGRTYVRKANPNQAPALQGKPASWRDLGSALLNDNAGRAEKLDRHELDGQGAAPTYKTGGRRRSVWRTGAMFVSRQSGQPAVLQTVAPWGRLKTTAMGKTAMVVLPSVKGGPPRMVSMASEFTSADGQQPSALSDKHIMVAYTRPMSKLYAGQTIVTPLSEFVRSFQYRSKTADHAEGTGTDADAECAEHEAKENEEEKGEHKESVLQRGWRALTGLVGGQRQRKSNFEGAAPPFGSPEREEWEAGGRKKSKSKDTEGQEKEESESSETEKQASALRTIRNVGRRHQAGVEFTKKPDGQINISVEADPAGGMGTGDLLNGQPVPPAGAPDALPAAEAPEVPPPSADGQQGVPTGPVKPPKKAALVVGQRLTDAALGEGTVESIRGQDVVAVFGGQKYSTTLTALGV